MPASSSIRSRRIVVVLCALPMFVASAFAYAPGSGTLFSENFNAPLDEYWELGNGFSESSPWTREIDGPDEAFNADGLGPLFQSPTRHWARRFVHPVSATSFSAAFEYRADLGGGYAFDFEVEQRAETLRKYRLRIDGGGAVSLWRSEGGALVQIASSGAALIPVDVRRWIRFAIEPDVSGHPRLRVRVWDGGATAEPTGWTLDHLDDQDTLVRVHRFELIADGPKGVETWIDDVDLFGDVGAGVDSSVRTIHLVELSHLDIGFTEPPDDIEAFAKNHLDQVLNNLEADPDYRWTIETGWWLDRWWERSGESQRQRMIDHLRSGRLILTAGYANLHTTTVGHEELSRAVYWSSRMAREQSFPLRTWITDDVPGSTFALPELLSRSGLDYFVGGMNTSFGGRVQAPDHGDRPFWWVGPDGSRVLAWTTFDSYAEAFQYGFSFFDNLDDMFDKLGRKLPEQEEAGYDYPELMLMRGFDNHYQGFHARNLVDQWNATYETPVFVLSTAEEFLDHMLATYGPDAFPSFSGDYGAAWARSKASTAHSREWVRQSHRDGRAAEALLAAGSVVDGRPVPRDDVDFMYRKMLEWDEHTGAGGWPGYFTPEEMDRNNRIHLGYAEDARDTATTLLEAGLDRALAELPASGDAVVAVNPLGHSRDGIVRRELPQSLFDSTFRIVDRATSQEVPFQRLPDTLEIVFRAGDVPSMGYRVFDLVPEEPTAVPSGMLEATATTLENDFYYLEVDPANGSLVSLLAKSTGRELVDSGSAYRFNELASSTKQQYDAQNPPTAEPPSSATVSIERTGPVVAALSVDRTGTPHVRTVYRLYRNEDRVEIENVLDRDSMPYVPHSVATRAYTVTLPFDVHDFEIRTETTTRFLDPVGDGFPRSGVFDWHNVEHTLALWDDDGGVVYAVDSVFSHHIENLSSLTSNQYSRGDALVLSRLYDRVDEYEFEGGSVGSFEVEPDTPPTVRFHHHVRATPPAFDPTAASRFGFASLTPIRSRLLSRRPGNLPAGTASFFSVDSPGVVLYTAKGADVGEGITFRLTELEGQAVTARIDSDVMSFDAPERVEQDEEGGVPISADAGAIVVPLEPYETATVRARATRGWSDITLRVDKNPASGSVVVTWSGGVTPYTLERAEDARFTTGNVTLVDEVDVTSHEDPVLGDGKTYYYLAK